MLSGKFESNSWFVRYKTGAVLALFFFLMDDDCNLVADIREKFPVAECFRFERETLMDLIGHDWPSVGHVRSKG